MEVEGGNTKREKTDDFFPLKNKNLWISDVAEHS